MYRFERAANGDQWRDHGTLWDDLAGNSPFRQSDWLLNWWEHFGSDENSYFVIARDEQGDVRGILPLYKSGLHGSVLRFVGDGNACSDGLSVLCRPEDASQIGREMGQWLASIAGDRYDGWSLLDMDGIIEGDQAMIALAQGLKDGGAAAHAQSRMSTWFKATTDTWEDYLKKLSSQERRKTRRFSEKIDGTPELSRFSPQSESDVRETLDAFIQVHQRRWNEVGQPGSYAEPKFREFVHDVAQAFYRKGKLRLATVRLNDQMIGGDFQLIGSDGTLFGYSTGMDTRYSDLKTGHIMNVETLLYAYKHKSPGVDYMRGDEPYKARLTAEPRRLIRLRIVPNSAWSRLQHHAWLKGFELAQWVRRKRGSQPVTVLPNLERTHFEPLMPVDALSP